MNFRSFLGLYFLLAITGSLLTISEYFSECIKTSASPRELLLINSESVVDEESSINFESEECEDDQLTFIENNDVLEIKTIKHCKISKL